jgi:hypothetical protein
MTTYELFLLALIALYFVAHLTARLGAKAGLPPGLISLAESAVTL